MALYKNKASQKFAVFAYILATGAAKTGDAANITAQISKDGGATAATDDTNPTELDATDAPGIYLFDALQAETNADLIVVAPVSSTSGVAIEPLIIYTEPEQRSADVTAVSGGTAAADNLQSACDNYSVTRGLAGTALPAAAADALGGLPISDAGGLDLDAKLANTHEITAARMGALTDWINDGRLDAILDAILADTGTDGVVVASASKTGYTLTTTTGLGNQTANITGNLSGSVGSVSGAVGSVAADVTADVVKISGSTTAANNAETVFDTDFATNYSNTNDKWQVDTELQGADGDTLETLSDQLDATSKGYEVRGTLAYNAGALEVVAGLYKDGVVVNATDCTMEVYDYDGTSVIAHDAWDTMPTEHTGGDATLTWGAKLNDASQELAAGAAYYLRVQFNSADFKQDFYFSTAVQS